MSGVRRALITINTDIFCVAVSLDIEKCLQFTWIANIYQRTEINAPTDDSKLMDV